MAQEFHDKLQNVVVVVYDQDYRLFRIKGYVRFNFFKFRLNILIADSLSCVDCGLRHMPHWQLHGKHRALVQCAFYSNCASVKLNESFDKRKPYARTLGMDTVHLIEPVEYITEVTLADSFSSVCHLEYKNLSVTIIRNGYRALSGVYLKAFERRLKNTRSIFSGSIAIGNGFSAPFNESLMSRFLAIA